MREIKFRVWDNFEKKFITLEDYQKLGAILVENDGTMSFSGDYAFQGSMMLQKDTFTPLQYTGLKDKNGKKIYEGDIIVVPNMYPFFDDGKSNYVGIVEWVYSQWQIILRCVSKDKRGISDGVNNGINDDGIDENGITQYEIIGNIYENPELLEDKK